MYVVRFGSGLGAVQSRQAKAGWQGEHLQDLLPGKGESLEGIEPKQGEEAEPSHEWSAKEQESKGTGEADQ